MDKKERTGSGEGEVANAMLREWTSQVWFMRMRMRMWKTMSALGFAVCSMSCNCKSTK